ncbi:hypothetical protein CSOJ01_07027 [Colletotrichum sojae]|uniref:Uncharacterized protein n=1 Tax=Colletotrichum sojae TaxID=2175907 RepID=A0A8H6J9V8_9PEZI|nr:hypothetical protein CSOJ01_07027 [Colletotrichum sojae]
MAVANSAQSPISAASPEAASAAHGSLNAGDTEPHWAKQDQVTEPKTEQNLGLGGPALRQHAAYSSSPPHRRWAPMGSNFSLRS